MSKKDWIEVGVSLFSGASLGAGLMYLFDPQVGAKRRGAIAAAAEEAAMQAGQSLGNAWQSMADDARHNANSLASRAGNLASGVSTASEDYADAARRRAMSWLNSASRGARGYTKDARSLFARHEDHPYARAGGITAGAVGALAIGAGIMFLFDPAQGRRRRALVRDKTASAARHTSEYARHKGQYLADKTRGMAAELKSKVSPKAEEPATPAT